MEVARSNRVIRANISLALRRSAQGDFEQSQAEQGVAGSDQVIGHHAKTIFDMLVKVTGRLRFGDIEEAEQGKGRALPEEGIRREQEDQPERDDFVPDDAAVIGITQTLTGFVDDPDAEKIGRGQPAEKSQIAEVVAQQRKTQPGQQGPRRARCPARQATAEAKCNEMRRVGEQESKSGRFGQSDQNLDGQIRWACYPDQALSPYRPGQPPSHQCTRAAIRDRRQSSR